MNRRNFETLSQAVDSLTKAGYIEDFEALDNKIIGNISRKEYSSEELVIVDSYRFEGDTNPDDEAIVFAIEASDRTKGTLVMSYSANHNQNVELIKNIPYQKNK
ncbi:MAG: phosphoribosylpyrophosphate synthetase [Flammeovirgaceae bacterium]|nr:phosphoribosylpyrophosphate synthetase [Flammeovirgaceae bacterium]